MELPLEGNARHSAIKKPELPSVIVLLQIKCNLRGELLLGLVVLHFGANSLVSRLVIKVECGIVDGQVGEGLVLSVP